MRLFSPLLTDYYQFTMAYGYWKLGRAEQEATFQLTFRRHPFKGNYTVVSGLANVIHFLADLHFNEDELEYLAQLKSATGKPTFEKEFIDYLRKLRFNCSVDAIPEGNLVFPQEPLIRVRGPLLQCQLLETPLINMVNFSSLITTRAAQICHVTKDQPVMEFGLRRAQGPDGGLTATRASYIGGCAFTSNVLAGKTYGIPVGGTQAHSWIMSYPDELTAFREFVKTTDNVVLLVDTYDTIQGIKNAITVGEELKKEGRALNAIRIDSGDLSDLSKKARKLLDKAGFKKTKIVVSGDLDLEKIQELKKKKSPIDMWGVGTKLTTAYKQPSLDAIYKLTTLKETDQWYYKMKISNAPQKTTLPGILQVRRYYKQQLFIEDAIYDTLLGIENKMPSHADQYEDLLIPIFKQGKLIYQQPEITTIRENCIKQVNNFAKYLKVKYPIYFEKSLRVLRAKLLREM